MAEWTEGVCSDGAAILRDGEMVRIEDLLAHLNEQERALDRAYRALCGYAMAAEAGKPLDVAARSYHHFTVAAAKQHVLEG